ncbi:hypothetical protein [Deinococcus multiflagellatus]|uniref:Uncharacterized protein n=1 Tax=Deinococcus multiflagellatus TaxID=1656887 RepID=A0ABW1ZQC3_9DEIO|nr:hypothetical protein [Deinococcus multiflagellatus]MBZ9715776.1 hypothetical protein [Deinococcus multiflagellatus]
MNAILVPLEGHGFVLSVPDGGPTLAAAHVNTQQACGLLVVTRCALATLLLPEQVALAAQALPGTPLQLLDQAHHNAGLVSLDGGVRLWRGPAWLDLPQDVDAVRRLLAAAYGQPPAPLAGVVASLKSICGPVSTRELRRKSERRPDFWFH